MLTSFTELYLFSVATALGGCDYFCFNVVCCASPVKLSLCILRHIRSQVMLLFAYGYKRLVKYWGGGGNHRLPNYCKVHRHIKQKFKNAYLGCSEKFY